MLDRDVHARLTLLALLALAGCDDDPPAWSVPLPEPEAEAEPEPEPEPLPPIEREDVSIRREMIVAHARDVAEVSDVAFDALAELERLVDALPPRYREGVEVVATDDGVTVRGIPIAARAVISGDRLEDRVDLEQRFPLVERRPNVTVSRASLETEEADGEGWDRLERHAAALEAEGHAVVVRRGCVDGPPRLALQIASAPTRGAFLRRAYVAPDHGLNARMQRGVHVVHVEIAEPSLEAVRETVRASRAGNAFIDIAFHRRSLFESWWAGIWPEEPPSEGRPEGPSPPGLAETVGRAPEDRDVRVLLAPTQGCYTPSRQEVASLLNALALLERARATAD